MEIFPVKSDEVQEAYERPDTVWVTLKSGTVNTAIIVDWSDIKEINGNFNTEADSVFVVGIPLYGTADSVLQNAAKYVFNQIDIFKKTEANNALIKTIGSGN